MMCIDWAYESSTSTVTSLTHVGYLLEIYLFNFQIGKSLVHWPLGAVQVYRVIESRVYLPPQLLLTGQSWIKIFRVSGALYTA